MKKILIITLVAVTILFSIAGTTRADIIYNLTLTGDVSGSGELVLKDGALATDGVFILSGALMSFHLDVPSIPVSFTSLETNPGAEYEVIGGALVGVDIASSIGGGLWVLDFANNTVGYVVAFGLTNPLILRGQTQFYGGTITAEEHQTPVAEPASLLLFGLGLVGIAGLKRKLTN